jgi:D-galacturonate reductase
MYILFLDLLLVKYNSIIMAQTGPPNALIVGTGEYATGYVQGIDSKSDKRCGVVALVFFHLRAREKLGPRVAMAGTSGTKLPAIRDHMRTHIQHAYGIDCTVETFPADDVKQDSKAYIAALDSMLPGDLVTVFTPDDTHFDIALAAIERGIHVLITKPPVKRLEQQRVLVEAARKRRCVY